ncbi:hypothetical protein [Intestinibacter bartlettii]|uniref:Uncharacterized protein n=1 Tax=Intestinibacter bartlettii TaxID=261299 RepID=A0ABS6DWJ5_9FIRM|nr:hypothetical protein [Intestinibacter bartlettii]MBU5335641.1 hypothetical protein [Intestinibacter bartlettii]MDO5009887.1 hypothetical protein [Intestinibacter bartlettii]
MKRKKRKHISQSKRSVRSSASNSSNNDSSTKSCSANSDTCSQNDDVNNEQNNCDNSNGNNNDNNQNTNDNSNNVKSKLCYFSAFDYFVLSSTLAIALAEELSDTDIDILSTFLATLSDQLALIGSVNSCAQGERENIFVPPIPAGTSSGGRCSTSSTSKGRSKKIVKRKIKKK